MPSQRKRRRLRPLVSTRRVSNDLGNGVDETSIENTAGVAAGITDSKTDLEMRLQMQTRELESARLELESYRNESQRFLSAISHDLKAPIRAITGFSRYLQEEYAGKLDADADDYITRIVSGAELLKEQISSLATLSSVTINSSPFVPVNLSGSLNQAESALSETIAQRGAVIECDDLPTVLGVEFQLTELLYCLIENAVKFNVSSTPTVTIKSELQGENHLITISDNGIGMNIKHLERAIEIFQRLNPKDKFSGVGAGLTISQRIVHHHFGKIWLVSRTESDPNFEAGTTVNILLPAIAE
jgi:light-regulated signal transduction histidine kinase (bacteriophytochrome)